MITFYLTRLDTQLSLSHMLSPSQSITTQFTPRSISNIMNLTTNLIMKRKVMEDTPMVDIRMEGTQKAGKGLEQVFARNDKSKWTENKSFTILLLLL